MRCLSPAGALLALAGVAVAASPRPGADVVRARLELRPAQAIVEMTISPGWHVNAHRPRDEFLIPTTVTLTSAAGVTLGEVAYPEPVERRLPFAGDRALLLYEGTVRFTAPVEGTAPPGAPPLRASLRYQACDETRCLPPRTVELTATDPDGGPSGGAGGRIERWITRFGLVPTLGLVALLGVALNLTPCVYPLISVTIAFFGGRTAGGGSAVWLALLYALGICLTFSVLGVTAALSGSLFGAALQQPLVLGGVALVLVLLAASNFGLYAFRFPTAVTRRLGGAAEGAVGAFVMGLTMGVVAAPCVGPLVVALLLFVGAQQSVPLGFALFFALGLGMGAPYVALAAAAGRLRRLPRGGGWLLWVEHALGFVLLGMALYFVAPLLPAAWTRIVTALLLAAAAVGLGFRAAASGVAFRWAQRTLGVALLGLALGGLFSAEARAPIAWMPFSDGAYAEALAAGRPVFLDFEADWCLPCREMDRTTFRHPDVVDVARAFAAFKVDVTTGDAAADAVMERFGVTGVPTYVLLGPDGRESDRFVGYVAADRMRAAMAPLAGDRG